MSFSSTAKEELIRLPLGKSCCILSELSALTQTSGSLAFRGAGRIQVTYRVENAALARRIFLLLRTQLPNHEPHPDQCSGDQQAD